MAEMVGRGRNLVLLCVVLALAAALPQCQSYDTTRFSTTESKKKNRSVDLRRGFRPRRGGKYPDRFSQGATTLAGDEFTTNMPAVYRNPEFVNHHRGLIARKQRVLQSVQSQESGIEAKAWPTEFTISFNTKWGHVTGFMAYDWANQRQAVYHGANSTFCQNFGTDEACQMLEVPSGTYVYIPSRKECSLTVAGVGSLPPEWTVHSEYAGEELVPEIGLCRTFAFPPTAHVWGETVVGALPCIFIFPDPSMTYYFNPQTFKVGTPEEKYFDFPDYCFEPSGSVESQ